MGHQALAGSIQACGERTALLTRSTPQRRLVMNSMNPRFGRAFRGLTLTSTIPKKRRNMQSVSREERSQSVESRDALATCPYGESAVLPSSLRTRRPLLGLLLTVSGLAVLIASLILFGWSAEASLHWTVLAECTLWLLFLCLVLGQEYSMWKSARHARKPQPDLPANGAPIFETLADPFPANYWLPSGRIAALPDLPGDAQTQVIGQVAKPVTGPPSCSLCGTTLHAGCDACPECGWNDSMISTAD